ncbi:MAG: uroporphyrinogen-III C-methyltransferase [Gammaproteobacteria bacterium]|nr:uroporphyrinogen-III C-methyltransferase [Gammaproteobacteria bacterium]
MEFLPIFLAIKQRPCLVIGGGDVAARKVTMLHKAGARIIVVAPELCADLQTRASAGEIEHIARGFESADLNEKVLVIAATDDSAVNQLASKLANEQGIPVNVVDNPALCSFIVPSILDRSPVMIAVSTGGASPVLARQLRSRLESMIPSAYGRLATLMDEFRPLVKEAFSDTQQRKQFWEDLLASPFVEMVLAGQDAVARDYIKQAIADKQINTDMGEVYLVGAGPGDPDLLTFRALRLMQQADVVVHDRLVSAPIMDMVRRDADRIYVGKEKDNHAVPQEEINQLLVDLAREGKRVLRLKGGDPFIFGRGGEEIDILAKEGVPFQVIPGITAAAGCASYAGIPLTHRDYAQSCTFVTGHLKDGSLNLNWNQLAQPRQTVVFYMGLNGIKDISREMMAHGVPADMPAALVEQGTTPNQRVHIGTISNLPELVKESGVCAPTLTIVGEVVELHEKLKWFNAPQHQSGSVFRKNGGSN